MKAPGDGLLNKLDYHVRVDLVTLCPWWTQIVLVFHNYDLSFYKLICEVLLLEFCSTSPYSSGYR